MKKLALLALFILVGSSFDTYGDFYVCESGDCEMYVIQVNQSFSWMIICEDGSRESGFVEGVEYVGNCKNQSL